MRKAIFVCIVLLSLQAKSQSTGPGISPVTFNIGGGSAEITSSFFIDWSIGESTIIETFQGENSYANSIIGIKWNVTSGILQPYDISHIIFNNLVPQWTNQEIRIYPVPTPGIVHIDLRSITTGKLSLQLMTLGGTLIGVKEFLHMNGNSTQSWNITNQPSGIYFLRIILSTNDGKILKQGTFKIEKIK